MGAGGVRAARGLLPAIQAVLDKHDVLMIADEVICGFGRLGHWFGSNRFDIRPDLMTIAKGLTSGYVPMSGSLIGEKIWQVIVDHSREIGPFGHGYTYTAHPVAAAAAMADLDIIEGEGLVDNAREVGAHFQRRMRQAFADHPLVGHVRGEGLIMGIELVADRASKRAFDPSTRLRPASCSPALPKADRAQPAGRRCRRVLAAADVTLDDLDVIEPVRDRPGQGRRELARRRHLAGLSRVAFLGPNADLIGRRIPGRLMRRRWCSTSPLSSATSSPWPRIATDTASRCGRMPRRTSRSR